MVIVYRVSKTTIWFSILHFLDVQFKHQDSYFEIKRQKAPTEHTSGSPYSYMYSDYKEGIRQDVLHNGSVC